MKVAVIGTGHVGLITSISLAARGHDVVGVDADAVKIAHLQAGDVPFYEPSAQEYLDRVTRAGRLRFTADPGDAIRGADVAFICVGTPAKATGDANLAAIEQVGRAVARSADGPIVIAEKSTVPAGTAERLERVVAL
ncbi:MAG TPA: 2-dehydropantoate 2-reductase N-terminal domain-containing protein, partial [Actinomycetota bacterium]|nr:2-dehydropantoate 2-reductase N-terminal domain-containing protein [Actinomycetota bacterium]